MVGRASAFAFRGRADNLKEVGAELGVTAILSGGVRRMGGRMRIAAELTDAESGYALWSERFDRGVTDMFAVQDEISRAIADSLRVQFMSGSQRLVDTPTRSFSAYESYLKGRFEWSQRTATSMRRAVVLSGESTESRSALAYALGRAGHEEPAREILRALHHEAASEYVSAVSLAQVYVALGAPGAALDQLERALVDRATALPLLGVRPSFAPLRAEPRFHRIIAALES